MIGGTLKIESMPIGSVARWSRPVATEENTIYSYTEHGK
jgi:hypothetical protein